MHKDQFKMIAAKPCIEAINRSCNNRKRRLEAKHLINFSTAFIILLNFRQNFKQIQQQNL